MKTGIIATVVLIIGGLTTSVAFAQSGAGVGAQAGVGVGGNQSGAGVGAQAGVGAGGNRSGAGVGTQAGVGVGGNQSGVGVGAQAGVGAAGTGVNNANAGRTSTYTRNTGMHVQRRSSVRGFW
jgi:hypothetical protein